MTTLPEKPAIVADVSDAKWEAALDAANPDWRFYRSSGEKMTHIIDHARCLILLGEVPEPVDPIEAAMRAFRASVWELGCVNLGQLDKVDMACRRHFAGLTFPAAKGEGV